MSDAAGPLGVIAGMPEAHGVAADLGGSSLELIGIDHGRVGRGVTLPLALAKLGLIDECEFVVLPRIAGHGPRLLDGLTPMLDLTLVARREFASGAVVLKYDVKRG